MIEHLIDKLKHELDSQRVMLLSGAVSDYTTYRVALAEYHMLERVIDMAESVAGMDEDDDDLTPVEG